MRPLRVSRPRLRLESLESRLNPGNLTITNALIVDANNNPQPNPVVGEDIYLRAEWQTSGLSSSDKYVVRYWVDGVPADSATISGQAGNGLTYSWYRNGWWLGPGPHTIQVKVDGADQVGESNENDNTFTFQVTPVEPTSLPAQFSLPLGGTPFQDWSVVNYADVDPGSPNAVDFRGGPYTYDGHDAWDITLPNFTHMDAGLPDVAAADGTVVQVVDGNFDRDTGSSSTPGNFVMIDHGNGWSTLYYHFMNGSITVHVGDHVTRGQVLGFAGSSGNSSDAHLHFTPYYNGCQVETMFDPTAYWLTPPKYQGDLPSSVTDSGISNASVWGDFKERPPEVDTFPTSTNWNVWAWFRVSHFNATDGVAIKWYQPGGTLNTTYTYSPGEVRYGGYAWTLPASTWSAHVGIWQVAMEVNGVERARRSFTVTSGAGPAVIRLSQGSTYVIDGRETPLDFGSVAAGSAAPQQTYTVQNLGSAALSLSGLALPPNFSLVGSLPASVAVNGSATFTIQMNTAAVGTQWGEVRFATNDPNHPSFHFAVTGTVTGAPAAGAPVIATDGTARGFTLGQPATFLDPTATVTDADSPNFNGGSLSVEFAFGGTADDFLGIADAGTGGGQIGVSFNNVTFGGTEIGRFGGGYLGAPLIITFNANATADAVQALLEDLTFADSSLSAATNPRRVRYTLTDDTGNVSNLAETEVIPHLPIDRTPPTVTVDQAAGQADPTNGSVTFGVVFSEPVVGFDATKVDLSGSTAGGPLSATVTGSGPTYTVTVTGMTSPGTVVAAVDPNAVTDPAGNGNLASTAGDNTVTFDNVSPTVTIDEAAGQADPAGGSAVAFDVVFNEPVVGFDGSKVHLSGTAPGTLSASVSGPGPAYAVTVTGMTGSGTVVASINAGAVTDLAGNGNQPSTSTDNTVTFVASGTVQFSSPTYTVDEAGAPTLVVHVTRTGGSNGTVSVDYATADGSATKGIDYTAQSGTLNWDDGDAADQLISIPILDDGGVEADSNFSIALSNANVSGALGTPAVATVTIFEKAVLGFTAATFPAAESDDGSTAVTHVTVSRQGGAHGVVSVDYAITGGTATAGSDYTVPAAVGTLTWGDGDTADKSIDVSVLDDGLSEGRETIDLDLSAAAGDAVLSPQTSAIVTIAPSDGTTVVGTARKPRATFSEDGTPAGDQVTLALGGKVGTATFYRTNGTGPIAEIDLSGTEPSKSTVAITVKKPERGTGDGRTVIGEVDGTGLKNFTGKTVDLDGAAGNGFHLTGFLGTLTVGNIENGFDLDLAGPAPAPAAGTRITAVVIGDGTDMTLAAPLKSLTAIAIGDGTITAPSVGSIAVKGRKATKTVPAIAGDFTSDLTVGGTGVAKGPALGSLRVAGAVSGSRITVGGMAGTVGVVSVGAFIDSQLVAGYSGPLDGGGSFNLPSTVKSFTVTGKTDAFADSYVVAANFKNVTLTSAKAGNGGTPFGFLFHTSFGALTVAKVKFKYDAAIGGAQVVAGDLEVTRG